MTGSGHCREYFRKLATFNHLAKITNVSPQVLAKLLHRLSTINQKEDAERMSRGKRTHT
jgi:hypothetical protein